MAAEGRFISYAIKSQTYRWYFRCYLVDERMPVRLLACKSKDLFIPAPGIRLTRSPFRADRIFVHWKAEPGPISRRIPPMPWTMLRSVLYRRQHTNGFHLQPMLGSSLH